MPEVDFIFCTLARNNYGEGINTENFLKRCGVTGKQIAKLRCTGHVKVPQMVYAKLRMYANTEDKKLHHALLKFIEVKYPKPYRSGGKKKQWVKPE